MTKRVLVGAALAGVILVFFPGNRSLLACLLAGGLTTGLLLLLGPRSIVEKAAAALLVGVVAWLAGPRAAVRESLAAHLFGWALVGFALAVYLHPRRSDP